MVRRNVDMVEKKYLETYCDKSTKLDSEALTPCWRLPHAALTKVHVGLNHQHPSLRVCVGLRLTGHDRGHAHTKGSFDGVLVFALSS